MMMNFVNGLIVCLNNINLYFVNIANLQHRGILLIFGLVVSRSVVEQANQHKNFSVSEFDPVFGS